MDKYSFIDDDEEGEQCPQHLRDVVDAIELGDSAALCVAIHNMEGNIDERLEYGQTVLHLSCIYGHISCVEVLLDSGACLEAKSEDGSTPLHDACGLGHKSIVQFLLWRGDDSETVKRMLESIDVEGDTPLHLAAKGKHVDVIRLLLANGVSPTTKNSRGQIPVELADPGTVAKRILQELSIPTGRVNGLIDEDEEEETCLFDKGFSFESDSDIPSHLHDVVDAIEQGNSSGLRVAIHNMECDIDERLEYGQTALHLSCIYGHMSCVEVLLDSGAFLEAKSEDGATPLHDASGLGDKDIVQFLLWRGDDPETVKRMLESVDVEGDTPLHHAARGEHVDVIQLLLANGASPTKKNSGGQIPSELADPGTDAKRILDAAVASVA